MKKIDILYRMLHETMKALTDNDLRNILKTTSNDTIKRFIQVLLVSGMYVKDLEPLVNYKDDMISPEGVPYRDSYYKKLLLDLQKASIRMSKNPFTIYLNTDTISDGNNDTTRLDKMYLKIKEKLNISDNKDLDIFVKLVKAISSIDGYKKVEPEILAEAFFYINILKLSNFVNNYDSSDYDED